MELADYLPIALMTILGIAFAGVSMFVSKKLAPNNPTPEKLAPYECGIVPLQDPVDRFPVKFYLVAMLFVIFDVETVFLFPWAVQFKQLALFGFVEMAIFIAILLFGYAYAWKRGALEWV